jgi:Rieske Fe-S protein
LRLARRSALDLGVAASAAALGAGGVNAALAFLEPAPRYSERSAIVGNAPDFAAGSGRVVILGEEPVLVLRSHGGELSAMSARCPHLGCVVALAPDNQHIQCACHGGRFALDGRVLAGPSPRPLSRYRAFEVDGAVVVERIG